MKTFQIVLLAAGKGKRMKSKNTPKVLFPLKDKPLIKYILREIKKSGICQKPVIIVGYKSQMVKKVLGKNYTYVLQKKQLGTGHAVNCARNFLENKAKNILILYGDKPCIKADSILKIINRHIKNNNILTMATIKIPDYKNWRVDFKSFGRVIRNNKGEIEKIVEKKEATPQELKIKEVSPSIFCFKANWLWDNIPKIKLSPQNEYYLTDLIQIIKKQKNKIDYVNIDPIEGLGINSQKQLKIVSQFI
ncbi:MAG: sugar phosphate nucleotidyltransferase [Patescibacteria group bacterium]|nr:sugar phosphate nucleotidyltransferase [Patescibacteria group bacterium]